MTETAAKNGHRTKDKPANILAWHWVASDRRLRYGEREPVEVGRTYYAEPPLSLCSWGLHASIRATDALGYAPGPVICRVRLGGTILHDTDKLCASEREVLWMADGTSALFQWVADCMDRALESDPQPDSEAAIKIREAIKITRDVAQELAAWAAAAWAAAARAAAAWAAAAWAAAARADAAWAAAAWAAAARADAAWADAAWAAAAWAAAARAAAAWADAARADAARADAAWAAAAWAAAAWADAARADAARAAAARADYHRVLEEEGDAQNELLEKRLMELAPKEAARA